MKILSKLRLASLALVLALVFVSPSRAETEKRIAFVVGNAAYQADPLATAANDAGLIAQTLQAAGFDVSGARDLDGESLRAAFRDFLDKAQASGPDTVAFVYLAGYGLQLDGENYFVPVDAKITSASDVAVEALRISDYTKRLAGLPLKASFIVLDAARESPFAKSGPPLAGGLALADAEPNMLLAFNATPGTVAPTESGPYGAYARALTEMIREGGLPPSDVFDGVRLRVNEETKGALVPWDATRIAAPFVFFVRAADAPPPPSRRTRSAPCGRSHSATSARRTPMPPQSSATRCKAIRSFSAPIHQTRSPIVSAPCSPPAARPSHGGEPTASIRRTPTGPIWNAIRAVRMWPTRAGALRRSQLPWSRHLYSSQLFMTCRRPRPRKSFTLTARCWSSAIPCLASSRRRPSFTWLRCQLILTSRRRRRRMDFLCCRFLCSCRSRFGSIRLSMWRRRRKT